MRHPNIPPILITSSATPMEYSGKLNDPQSRMHYTLEGVSQWLQISPTLKLVICDGSGFDFTELVRQRFPQANIECLSFLNDREMVLKKGKGYGEGAIIQYALAHSAYLKDADYFAKCTGKLWVDNFFECLCEWNGQFLAKAYFQNVFSFKKTKLEYIDTRFYLVSKNFYQQYFGTAYLEVGGEGGLSIEDEFLKRVISEVLHNILFRTPPIICGVGGGSGKYYRNNFIRRLKEKLRSRLVQAISRFKHLFGLQRQ